ncbi:hypothetical protein M407DRAFT_224165 [Tulasnella calospora MUT 4182]|uniref:ornithine carbamoyltransferase n=1 Tax=Tulasnella calospora MUT 4182 TaxID=1051891 RepID=A0A0C3PVR4_9AGAM|nr:hypothetical protein M407DRAFT_224165 [Tulasnella calospora MUT 4182]
MCQGIFARLGEHEEIEELARHSHVPVLNALSSLWHPTQIMADLLTLHEHAHLFSGASSSKGTTPEGLQALPTLAIAWVGDSSNVLHDTLVTYPRLGNKPRVGTPSNRKYHAPSAVWDQIKEVNCEKGVFRTDDPREAVDGADVVVTDTWISMGQEHEKSQRLKGFNGFQVTEKLCRGGGANPNWKFLHCLPRKEHEVDDEVFHGPRSLVFPEAENRKWIIWPHSINFSVHWKL